MSETKGTLIQAPGQPATYPLIESGERTAAEAFVEIVSERCLELQARLAAAIAERDEARAVARYFNQSFPRETRAIHEAEWPFLKTGGEAWVPRHPQKAETDNP